MGIDKIFKSVVKNKNVQAKIQKVVIDKAIEKSADVIFKFAEDGANDASNFVKTTAKDIRQTRKKFDEKYKRLSELVINPDTVFNDYVNGLEEAENMVKFYQNQINSLSMMNPASHVKKQTLVTKSKKWKSLIKSLTKDVSLKMEKECRLIFETKVASHFFKGCLEINNELLACKTIQEINEYKSKIFKRYIDAFPTHLKYVDLFEF